MQRKTFVSQFLPLDGGQKIWQNDDEISEIWWILEDLGFVEPK